MSQVCFTFLVHVGHLRDFDVHGSAVFGMTTEESSENWVRADMLESEVSDA